MLLKNLVDSFIAGNAALPNAVYIDAVLPNGDQDIWGRGYGYSTAMVLANVAKVRKCGTVSLDFTRMGGWLAHSRIMKVISIIGIFLYNEAMCYHTQKGSSISQQTSFLAHSRDAMAPVHRHAHP